MARVKKEDSIGLLSEQLQKARALLHKAVNGKNAKQIETALAAANTAQKAYNECVKRHQDAWAKRAELA